MEDHTGARIILDTITAAASFTSEFKIALGAPAFIMRVYYLDFLMIDILLTSRSSGMLISKLTVEKIVTTIQPDKLLTNRSAKSM